MFKKRERYITVTDDWHPCYEGNQIMLNIHLIICEPNLNVFVEHPVGWVGIQAWGNDDTYVEKEFSVKYDGTKYTEFEYGHDNKREKINEYTDDTNTVYKQHLEEIYRAWKRDIFDCVPDGVNRQWFLENGFGNGI